MPQSTGAEAFSIRPGEQCMLLLLKKKKLS